MQIHPAVRHEPDSDHPGWSSWEITGPPRFNNVMGKLLVRRDENGVGRCRMVPDSRHSNLGEKVHGGALMAFIDVALYAGGAMTGGGVGMAVTLDCNVQFLAPAEIGVPLDAEVELLKETGRLVFLRGRLVQHNVAVAAFSATLRKAVLDA